jgi:hypothetical protein
MRPLAVLIGIVMGSTVSITLGLVMTAVVFLLLPEHRDRLAVEEGPLARAFLLSLALSAVAACSFYGEIRGRRWRLAAHAGLVALTCTAAWVYWPA